MTEFVEEFAKWCLTNRYRLTALELYEVCGTYRISITFFVFSHIENDLSLSRRIDDTRYNEFEKKQELQQRGKRIDLLDNFVKQLMNGDEVKNVTKTSGVLNTTITPFDSDGGVIEMIKARDDRIAVLEHQLRCLKIDLSDSRTRLGSLQEEHLLSNVKEKEKEEKENGGIVSDATSIERGALNCIVKQYLTNSGYKLTSLTFTEEEQSQDLDALEEYGLHIGNRSSLVDLYRSRIGPIKSAMDMEDELHDRRIRVSKLEEQVSSMGDEMEELRERYAEMSHQCQVLIENKMKERKERSELSLEITRLRQENTRMKRELEENERKETEETSQETQLLALLTRQLPQVASSMVITQRMSLMPLLVRVS